MATIPLDHVFRAVLQMRTIDKIHTVGLHYHQVSGFDAVVSAQNLANAVATTVGPAIVDCLSEDSSLEGVYVTHTLPETAAPYSLSLESIPGSTSGNALPPNSCAVIALYSDQPELSRPGRIFLGGLSKESLTDGKWDGTFLTSSLTALAVVLVDDLSGTGGPYAPVIIRRQEGGIPITPFAVSVDSYRVTDGVYSQQRRTTKQYGTFN